MRPGLSRTGLAVALLVAACLVAPLSAALSAATAPSVGALAADAQFDSWTWFGTGSPCTPGSNLTFVAHFNGTATGGAPPYRFSWNFGDGSNATTLENPTHIYAPAVEPVVAVLTATDSIGMSNTSSVKVIPATFNCPEEPLPIPPTGELGTAPSGLVYWGAAGIVAGGAASLYVLARRGDRPPG